MSNTHQESVKFAEKKIVLSVPDSMTIPMRQDIVYRPASPNALKMDIYFPPEAGEACAAVILITGYRDAGFQKVVGCKPKEMGFYRSWARLIAHSGMAAILYENADPIKDAHHVLTYTCENARSLGLDPSRVALWACSGNVPNALSLLRRREALLACAVFSYGYMLDDDSSSYVAEAARKFGFVTPQEGDAISQLPRETPFLIVRAGKDQMPGLLGSIDCFLSLALRHDVPVSLINHAQAPHAFDLDCDDDNSRQIIRHILSFLNNQLINDVSC